MPQKNDVPGSHTSGSQAANQRDNTGDQIAHLKSEVTRIGEEAAEYRVRAKEHKEALEKEQAAVQALKTQLLQERVTRALDRVGIPESEEKVRNRIARLAADEAKVEWKDGELEENFALTIDEIAKDMKQGKYSPQVATSTSEAESEADTSKEADTSSEQADSVEKPEPTFSGDRITIQSPWAAARPSANEAGATSPISGMQHSAQATLEALWKHGYSKQE